VRRPFPPRATDLIAGTFSAAFQQTSGRRWEDNSITEGRRLRHSQKPAPPDPDSFTILNNIGVVNRERSADSPIGNKALRVNHCFPALGFVFVTYKPGSHSILRGD